MKERVFGNQLKSTFTDQTSVEVYLWAVFSVTRIVGA